MINSSYKRAEELNEEVGHYWNRTLKTLRSQQTQEEVGMNNKLIIYNLSIKQLNQCPNNYHRFVLWLFIYDSKNSFLYKSCFFLMFFKELNAYFSIP